MPKGKEFTHRIKIFDSIWPKVELEEKLLEIRFNDRGYQKGDFVKYLTEDGLHERDGLYQITYVHSGLGMKEGFVVFSTLKVG